MGVSHPSPTELLQSPHPALHVSRHAPFWHVEPDEFAADCGQMLPQPPQLLTSCKRLVEQSRSVEPTGQRAHPVAHGYEQVPPAQVRTTFFRSASQRFEQLPQKSTFCCRSTHCPPSGPPQQVGVAPEQGAAFPHRHSPPAQALAVVPQEPQLGPHFAASVDGVAATHAPSVPLSQVRVPRRQTPPSAAEHGRLSPSLHSRTTRVKAFSSHSAAESVTRTVTDPPCGEAMPGVPASSPESASMESHAKSGVAFTIAQLSGRVPPWAASFCV